MGGQYDAIYLDSNNFAGSTEQISLSKKSIKSANWHMTSYCNYRCTFCCMQKLTGDLTSIDEAKNVLNHLKRLGIEKINFVGGEPMCNALIFDLTRLAKSMGFIVGITSNGSMMNDEVLIKFSGAVDWIGLSIDSASDEIEKKLGRGNGSHVTHCQEISETIHNLGIKLKINTTVTRDTFQEDMRDLIRQLDPSRWKIFQFLHVKGQNDAAVGSLTISDEEFSQFRIINENIRLSRGASPVFETAACMIDSYLMITPRGMIFLNVEFPFREYPIESIQPGMLADIINIEKYLNRGAVYDWH